MSVLLKQQYFRIQQGNIYQFFCNFEDIATNEQQRWGFQLACCEEADKALASQVLFHRVDI